MPERSSRDAPIHILLADDHQILRHGLKLLLTQHPEIAVVGEAGTGEEAIAQALSLHPDEAARDCARTTSEDARSEMNLL